MNVFRRALAPLLVAVVVAGGIASAQSDEPTVLARPLTPGSVAQLVDFPNSAAAEQRLKDALSDAAAPIRAAAARIVFVTAHRTLAPAVAAALARETDVDALIEEARALGWLGDDDSDRQILAAWQRVPADNVILALAAARGGRTLEHLPLLRERSDDEQLIAAYLRLATKREPAQLTEIARTAIGRVDRALLSSVLAAWRDAHATVPDEVLIEAVRGLGRSPLLEVVIWHLLEYWNGTPAGTREAVRPYLLAAVASPDVAPSQPEALIAYELIRRAFGLEPREGAEWLELLAHRRRALDKYVQQSAVTRLWTDQERQIVAKAYSRDIRQLAAPTTITVGVPSEEVPVLYVAAGYPADFVKSVMSVSGCSPSRFDATRVHAAGSQIVFRADGRVAQITLIDTGTRGRCADAARTLMMTFAAPIDRPAGEGARVLLMVPLSSEFVACEDQPAPLHLPVRAAWAEIGGERFPTVVKSPKPVYPEALMPLEGEVKLHATVSPKGCVDSAEVVKSVHPLMDWNAAWTAIGFGFKPAGDVTTDAQINVIIGFNVRR